MVAKNKASQGPKEVAIKDLTPAQGREAIKVLLTKSGVTLTYGVADMLNKILDQMVTGRVLAPVKKKTPAKKKRGVKR